MSKIGNPLCAAVLLAFVVMSLTLLVNNWHSKDRDAKFTKENLDADLAVQRSLLVYELNERRKEILPFLILNENEMVWEESEHISRDPSTKSKRMNGNSENAAVSEGSIPYSGEIGCNELVEMRAVDVLGSGYTKLVLKVLLSEGQPVALKFVNDQGADMGRCLEEFKDPEGCHELVSYKLKKEIVLLQKLKHRNIIKLQGHCEEEGGGGGGRRITAILEQGSPLQMIQLLQSPWEERFRVCLGLARLLHYLSVSPLGSVVLLDFQPRQFVLVSGELKLTDLDDASVREPECRSDQDCVLQFPLRTFNLSCSPQGLCEGHNERRNLYNAYRYFFTYLLPHQAPSALTHLVERIMNSTGELQAGINKTLEAFEEVLQLYQSGPHLDNLPPALLRDYSVMRGVRTSGDVGYRCWGSYSHQGCLLSVQSPREAALLCSSQSHCTSFSLSQQKTWTGRPLASFRTGFSHLVPDETSEVYLRKTKASGATV
ncbi:extracellular tyrosine-protein kinase PKDCC [Osmerus eperlanus]|uniref:extracellular tyrosine-protein kinase PKDCC n=1 Tax=Osmerus eperlanus TaxID=29151 RepID=UPI002E0F4C43